MPNDMILSLLAEREGFEPSIRVAPHTAFREQRLQPLGHLSNSFLLYQDMLIFFS